MITSTPEVLPVFTPAVYVPPPPTPSPPLSTISLYRCLLCHAYLGAERATQHEAWHKANGLHGWDCDALASLSRRYATGDQDAPIDACSCGLEPNKEGMT